MTETLPENLTFEDAMAQLEAIVRQLESGRVKLDEAVAAYERGMALKTFCADRLREITLKIEKVMADSSGAVKGLEPLDAPAG
ncbi:exodeoxyribonuclease 7 small subunit [Alphaproteobacteria bacterium]|nr:exodeoxyribonuclease 7 small subunit [Alphaproteobacteria bacterium]